MLQSEKQTPHIVQQDSREFLSSSKSEQSWSNSNEIRFVCKKSLQMRAVPPFSTACAGTNTMSSRSRHAFSNVPSKRDNMSPTSRIATLNLFHNDSLCKCVSLSHRGSKRAIPKAPFQYTSIENTVNVILRHTIADKTHHKQYCLLSKVPSISDDT